MNVAQQRKRFYQRSGLKEHPASDMQLFQFRAFESMQILPENTDLTGRRFQDSNQYIQERTLATSAPAQNDKGLFWKNIETDPIKDRPSVRKNLGQIAHFQNGRPRFRNCRFPDFWFNLDCRIAHCQTS